MLERRVLNRGSITDSSVHNCRVKRAQSDVSGGVLCYYANLFLKMKKMNKLSIKSDGQEISTIELQELKKSIAAIFCP